MAASEAQKGDRINQAIARLVNSTPGATTLGDVQLSRGVGWAVLIAEESGLPLEEVQDFLSRPS